MFNRRRANLGGGFPFCFLLISLLLFRAFRILGFTGALLFLF